MSRGRLRAGDEDDEFDDRPPRLGLLVAFGLIAVSVVLAGSGSGLSLALAVIAFALMVGGLFVRLEPLMAAGAVLLFFSHLVRLGAGGDIELSILGAIFAVAAWDVGEHTHDLGHYVGREGRSKHAVLTHAMASLLVGIAPVAVGYIVFAIAPGGRPLSALVLLLLAAVLITVGLRQS